MNQEQIRDVSPTEWNRLDYMVQKSTWCFGVWECQIRSARSILAGLLKTHGHSLNDEELRTPVAETEAIINSRPLTVESLSDINSEIPLSPSNLLTMKVMLLCHQQECSIDQTCTHVEDGDDCSILLGNFGPIGQKNSFIVSKHDKNGL